MRIPLDALSIALASLTFCSVSSANTKTLTLLVTARNTGTNEIQIGANEVAEIVSYDLRLGQYGVTPGGFGIRVTS